jgi:DNA (cytosine-5)-methyltransferase 1
MDEQLYTCYESAADFAASGPGLAPTLDRVSKMPLAVGPKGEHLTVAGLFAGIGGLELGLRAAGHTAVTLCEIDPGAAAVLARRCPDADLARDVRELKALPQVDLVAAGFPCQDLSQAGQTRGIRGRNSGLVGEVFRLLDLRKRSPRWLLLENVSFMLQLDRGRAMRYLVDELEARGYTWAYRIVNTLAFGLPQRRKRVILLASRREDPRDVILADDAEPAEPARSADTWCGFYWTEGIRGLGWAVDGVPTLKGGSTIGIPSPPAIWKPRTGEIVTPEIRDAERLQGFPADWTLPAVTLGGSRTGHRWKLVGNAVSVPVARWIGERLATPGAFDKFQEGEMLARGVAWPNAAWGGKGKVYAVAASMWPVRRERPHLSEFLEFPLAPLSLRAAQGFRSRMEVSSLRFDEQFRRAVEEHAERAARAAVA